MAYVSTGSIEGYIQRDRTPGHIRTLYHTVEHWISRLLTTAKPSEEAGLQAVMANLKLFKQKVVDDWVYVPILKTIKEKYAGSGNGAVIGPNVNGDLETEKVFLHAEECIKLDLNYIHYITPL